MKNTLRQNNIIKAGSNAPEDVLRTIYTNSKLSGKQDIISLHNSFGNILVLQIDLNNEEGLCKNILICKQNPTISSL